MDPLKRILSGRKGTVPSLDKLTPDVFCSVFQSEDEKIWIDWGVEMDIKLDWRVGIVLILYKLRKPIYCRPSSVEMRWLRMTTLSVNRGDRIDESIISSNKPGSSLSKSSVSEV